jgi:hypothetical protein
MRMKAPQNSKKLVRLSCSALLVILLTLKLLTYLPGSQQLQSSPSEATVDEVCELSDNSSENSSAKDTEGSEFTTAESSKAIVIYFSRAENIVNGEEYADSLEGDLDAISSASVMRTEDNKITGNIGLLAEWIAEATEADIFSIHVKEPYPQLKKETQEIVLQEQLYGDLPEVEPCTLDLEPYDLVYLGFPNWYGEPPRALYTFLKENNLDGKSIIPFTSDDRNGFSDAIDILKSMLPNSVILSEDESLLVNRKDLFASKEQTQIWATEAKQIAEARAANPLSTSQGQKEAAIALIGQTLTEEEIEQKLGKYLKFSRGTNG